jgi:beta-lactamase class A
MIFLMTALLNTGALTVNGGLQHDIGSLATESDGRVGICALDIADAAPVCVNAGQHFPLQSVMKLVVAAAVMNAVDRQAMRLDDAVVVRPEDASPGPQDFADLVRRQGSLKTTIEDLMRRAVIDSDSTSIDVLTERLGGVSAVQDFLQRKHIAGVRIDRNERRLQAESVGLTWTAAYADSDKFEVAIKILSPERREAAWNSYLNDPRDTATPEGMVRFLKALAAGQLLSAVSTQKILGIMTATATGTDRLKAGIPAGWSLGHKTGTGRVWKGMRSAFNDVGIVTAPDGRRIAVAVFISASQRTDAEQAALMTKAAQLITSAYASKR